MLVTGTGPEESIGLGGGGFSTIGKMARAVQTGTRHVTRAPLSGCSAVGGGEGSGAGGWLARAEASRDMDWKQALKSRLAANTDRKSLHWGGCCQFALVCQWWALRRESLTVGGRSWPSAPVGLRGLSAALSEGHWSGGFSDRCPQKGAFPVDFGAVVPPVWLRLSPPHLPTQEGAAKAACQGRSREDI